MVRSLWSAATGMNAQQTNVDTIANNLANVNTVGYKSQVAQFKSLLYQTLQTATTTANGDPKPTTSQVGLGVRNSSINSIFTQGSLTLNANYVTSKITITKDGTICYPDAQNNPQSLGITIGMYQFNNPGGLQRKGDTLWAATAASGTVMNEATNRNVTKSRMVQGYLEGSNVQVADEMVNLIVAQRAYEMNSKAITTTDEMMQTANNLKR